MAPVMMAVSGVRGGFRGRPRRSVPRMTPPTLFAPGYLIAWGLMGDPVPPVITRGGAQKKNS